MTTLYRCRFCALRVMPREVVWVGDQPSHPACGDRWYAKLNRLIEGSA